MTKARVVRHRRVFPLVRLREKAANAFWLLPTLLLLGALVLSAITHILDGRFTATTPTSVALWSASAATQVLSVLATAMLSFLAVVFSITMVAMQLASQQFSPRVLRTYVRSTTTKIALGTFVAAFVYPLFALAYVERTEGPGGSAPPTVTAFVASLLALASLILFIVYVSHTINLMRVTYAIRSVAQETRSALRAAVPPESAYMGVPEPILGEPLRVVRYRRPPWSLAATRASQGVIMGTDTVQLVRLASRDDCVIRTLVQVGDYVSEGAPVFEVHPRERARSSAVPGDDELLRTIDVGPERTVYQDPSYGVRELVDVAVQALSPAVNAPTTAVQVIDRLEDILAQVARRPDVSHLVADEDGTVRLVAGHRGWDDLVSLSLTEIQEFGAGSPQVTRRLFALLEHLLAVASEPRREALLRQQASLAVAVAARVPEGASRELAHTPDRRGLG